MFEASGNARAVSSVFDLLAPGGCVVFIGMPGAPLPIDIVAAQVKEARMETVFRYAHVYPRAIALLGSGKINLDPIITDRYPFEKSVEAFVYAAAPRPESMKIIIDMQGKK